MRVWRLLLTGLLLVAPTACTAPTSEPARPATSGASRQAADPPGDGVLRVLFLGNSHTARHDVPGTVAALLQSALAPV